MIYITKEEQSPFKIIKSSDLNYFYRQSKFREILYSFDDFGKSQYFFDLCQFQIMFVIVKNNIHTSSSCPHVPATFFALIKNRIM